MTDGTETDHEEMNTIPFGARARALAHVFAGMLLVITCLGLAYCSGCAGVVAVHDTTALSPRGEYDAAVAIVAACPFGDGTAQTLGPVGSGVVIAERAALTALHVVAGAATGCVYFAVDRNDQAHAMTVDVTLPDRDIARLVPVAEDPGFRAGKDVGFYPRWGKTPELRTVVCIASAVPAPESRCGLTQRAEAGQIRHDAITQPGNSGSGLYNRAGELVGIVTTLRTIFNGQVAGGGATALEGLEWLAPQ